MHDEASLPQTLTGTPPPRDEPLTPAGTAQDPHRTVDFQTPPATGTGAELPRVPAFHIEKELARGGMGVVFQARDTALNRTVAVKLLQDRHAPASTAAARFLDEARITGQLQHPGIPPIYQAGLLADGRPFLAMKLIQGETLDAKINAGEKLNYLALLEAVAQAVGYAHARGVVHRDLKPPNIMVGAFGEVQVMDWGLAKVLRPEDQGTRRPDDQPNDAVSWSPGPLVSPSPDHRTQAGAVLGTPAYMAPEQAAGEVDKIDARSDVFGLGGVLCAMLTGQPPYTGPDPFALVVHATGGRTAEAFARLDACGAEPEVIALCKRCLAFAPNGRPADGHAVAQEVAALRAAAEERAKHAAIDRAKAEAIAAEQRKRRQVWLGLAVTLLAALLASGALAAWAVRAQGLAQENAQRAKDLAQQARSERDQKEEQRKTAVEQSELANAVQRFLKYDVLQLADPDTQQEDRSTPQPLDANTRLQEVLLRAAKVIDGKFATQPHVEADLRWTIGYTLFGMGRYDLAALQYERVRALFTRLHGPDHPLTLTSAFNLANSQALLGQDARAVALFEDVLARQQIVLGPGHQLTLRTGHSLALGYCSQGRHAEALPLFQNTLARQQAALGPDHPDTLTTMYSLATSYAELGRHDEAVKLLQDTQQRQLPTLGRDHPHTLRTMHSLAACHLALDRPGDALQLFEETVPRMKAALGPEHPVTLESINGLANTYAALDRPAAALRLYREACAVRERRAADHPRDLENRAALGGVQCNIGNALCRQGKFADSLPAYDRAVEQLHEVLRQQPRNVTAQMFLRNVHWGRAQAYEQLHRHAEADADWARAIELTPADKKAAETKVRDAWKAIRKP